MGIKKQNKEDLKPKISGEVLNMVHQMHGMLLSLCLNMQVKISPKKLEVIYFTMEKKLLKVILETKNKMINKKEEIKPKDSGEMLNMMHQMHGMLLSLCLNMQVKNSPKRLEMIYFTMEKKLLKVILEKIKIDLISEYSYSKFFI